MPWTTPATFTAGSVLTAAQLNTNVRDNTNMLYTSVQRLAFTQRTTNYTVSATTVATAVDVFTGGGSSGSALTWTAAGSTAYRVEFYCPYVDVATNVGNQNQVYLVDGSGNDLGRLGLVGTTNGTQGEQNSMFAVYYYTPAAGSTTINVRSIRIAGNGLLACGAGGVGNNVPMWLAVFGPPLA